MSKRRTAAAGLIVLNMLVSSAASGGAEAPPRPSILWITCEDMSPHLGCYGDLHASTPNLDRLAAAGVRYTLAFAPIGVCAPSRSTLITGVWAPSLGTHHMRCDRKLPEGLLPFPAYLRQAGYYCSNNSKTDYNFRHPPSTWDESSPRAHWRKRKPGQPFFAVFNLTVTHESQIRQAEKAFAKATARLGPGERCDPGRVPIPPYHPDVPEVRLDWARYRDLIGAMDRRAGDILRELDEDGLAGDTIVFFFSDHGAGMPRSKRWLYDSSLRVPLIARFPEKWRALAPGAPGSICDRLVSFVDFGPTMLSLAGVPIPGHMQGVPFLGAAAAPPREYVFGFRDRMDERYDAVRAVRDRRFKYIRNYFPRIPYSQFLSYMYEMPTMKVWDRLAREGKLRGPERAFFLPKPPEELYDTWADPHEVHNLAGDPDRAPVLERMRGALREWMLGIADLGFLPEPELESRFGGRSPHEAVRQEPGLYPLPGILAAAELSARPRTPESIEGLLRLLSAPDSAIRFWAASGLGGPGDGAAARAAALEGALADPSPSVRVAAAAGLCEMGLDAKAVPVLAAALGHGSAAVRLAAANALDGLGERAAPAREAMRKALEDKDGYVVRVMRHALGITPRADRAP